MVYVLKHFFSQRLVNLWNSHPEDLNKLWPDAPFATDPNAPTTYLGLLLYTNAP